MSCNQLDYKITHHGRLKIYKTHLPSVQMRQSPQPQLVLDSDQVREVGRLMFREGHHLCPSYRKARKLLYILFEFISLLDPENLTTNIIPALSLCMVNIINSCYQGSRREILTMDDDRCIRIVLTSAQELARAVHKSST